MIVGPSGFKSRRNHCRNPAVQIVRVRTTCEMLPDSEVDHGPKPRRRVGFFMAVGAFVGATSFSIAEFLVPADPASPGDHDFLLAARLGFVFTPVAGAWLGFVQRSWRRAATGAAVGIALGFVYMRVSQSRNFTAVMVGYPALLGGALAGSVGSSRSDWASRFIERAVKGTLSGFVLGSMYSVVLTLVAMSFSGIMCGVCAAHDPARLQRYVSMMWRAGPIALGLGSALFFPLIQWAVGLSLRSSPTR
jgi:hypothetical protein